MLDYIVVCAAALIVAALTLFSGFGLGTVLMPVFAIFFPLEIAIAATAVVHLANNVFKVFLIGKWADTSVVLRFALPAAASAFVGAFLLSRISHVEPLLEYRLAGRLCAVTVIKLLVGLLIAGFTLFELVPRFKAIAFDQRYISFGGVLSGFFGGLSGHQGALRSAFLIRAGLQKRVFLGTVVVSAVIVDVARLIVYGANFYTSRFFAVQAQGAPGMVLAATLAAFIGSFAATRLLEKVTMGMIQRLVGGMLLLVALGLAAGIV